MRKHIRPGTVLGLIAVVFAMGGTAFAATALTGKDIKNGSLTGADVKNGSLTKRDLSKNALNLLKGNNGTNGTNGAIGPQGPAGAKGEPGASGLKGARYAVAYYDVGDTNPGAIATVACDANDATSQEYVAISGGVQTLGLKDNGITRNTPVSNSFPGRMDWSTNTPKSNRLDGWIVQFGGGVDPKHTKIWALCVKKTADVPIVQTFTQSD